MARNRTNMRKIKEALRLRWECGLSESAVGEACHCGRTTVQDYLKRARVAGLAWEQVRDMDDADLERRLFPVQPGGGTRRPEPAWGEVARELRRKGVTLELLWEEPGQDAMFHLGHQTGQNASQVQ